MSSHHIVREKQEPAMLVLSLANFDLEYLGQLLEWSPTLLAAPPATGALLQAGIHIDYLLTTNEDTFPLQAGQRFIMYTGNDARKAGIEFLIAQGYPAVNIIAEQAIPEDFEPYINKINIVYYCGCERSYAIAPGYTKWYPAGTIIRLNNPPANLKCNNLVTESHGRNHVEKDGYVNFKFSGKKFFLTEEI